MADDTTVTAPVADVAPAPAAAPVAPVAPADTLASLLAEALPLLQLAGIKGASLMERLAALLPK